MIDSKQAADALSDIDDIVRRVRQSRTYEIASLIMIWWGVLVLIGNLANYGWPRHGAQIWTAVNIAGVIGTFLIGVLINARSGMRGFEGRLLAAYLLFFAFGLLCSQVLGDFGPRELAAFWPIYFMLFYILAGLWFGRAFIAIGAAITLLTLIGYFYVLGAAFLLWMAVVNGGGLILGGLWMRWD
ncbi:hypothetical protein [Bradyrhizobium sp. ARR65]|uniref:hypothetical protein n=1 Tax=Bradyrhizobium sp. ARR65 TaxID=1040989 RepID=UPI000464BE90|nr:hypothetical protein [Bradyrhizobium sp. ARR65]